MRGLQVSLALLRVAIFVFMFWGLWHFTSTENWGKAAFLGVCLLGIIIDDAADKIVRAIDKQNARARR